ncbi:hypothetical protein H4F47_09835 [Pectobacterium brasiliense]|uniref:hypothetical protein n=1 Tax=Pectobacterium TaxID=122277 RepID=UPI0019693061|nr:hypothetical protein [Pectobacterium brasiliense]MBN3043218.1 hypothetical protein [Pectobacterium brasiliense]
MKLEDIANFAGNVVTFAGLPALIFFNVSAVLFFLNEWRIPLFWGAASIFILALIYYIRNRVHPKKSTFFLLLMLATATGSAVFYDPYPKIAQISISGFYHEKEGAWVSSNTDENTQDIIRQMEDTWNRATSKENPSFRFIEPFAIKSWQFPTLFLAHRSKQQIIKLAEENSRSVVNLVGFTRDSKLDSLHYSLNEKTLAPNEHGTSHENRWFNNLFAKIIDHPTLIDSQKREVIAKILFIDINARALSIRVGEMDAIGMANLIANIQDEIVALQKKHSFIKDELNYLMAGLTTSFIDVYDDELPKEIAADFLVQALSFDPYYPYPDKESFQRAYVKMSYANWRLSNDSEDDVTLLSHLTQTTYSLPDIESKNEVINDFRNHVFLPHISPVMFYYMLEMMKTAHPLLDIPSQQVEKVRELEEYTDKFLSYHPGIANDFIELKTVLLYSVYYTWYKKVNLEKDAARILKKYEAVLENNKNITPFLMTINEKNCGKKQ